MATGMKDRKKTQIPVQNRKSKEQLNCMKWKRKFKITKFSFFLQLQRVILWLILIPMKYFTLIISIFFLLSCDPSRRINMLNKTNHDAEIIFKLKEDSAKTSPFFISNSTKINFNLKNEKPQNFASMSFGLGKWTKASIKNIADDLESLEIKHTKDSMLFNSEDQIAQYLFAKRKGTFKSRIDITVQ